MMTESHWNKPVATHLGFSDTTVFKEEASKSETTIMKLEILRWPHYVGGGGGEPEPAC